jgi:hypothetical protein
MLRGKGVCWAKVSAERTANIVNGTLSLAIGVVGIILSIPLIPSLFIGLASSLASPWITEAIERWCRRRDEAAMDGANVGGIEFRPIISFKSFSR